MIAEVGQFIDNRIIAIPTGISLEDEANDDCLILIYDKFLAFWINFISKRRSSACEFALIGIFF